MHLFILPFYADTTYACMSCMPSFHLRNRHNHHRYCYRLRFRSNSHTI
jgi:hypothetical protein